MGKHRAPELTVHPDAAGDTSPQKFISASLLAPDFGADLNDDGALHQFTAAELVRLAEKLTGAAVAAAYEAGRRSARLGALATSGRDDLRQPLADERAAFEAVRLEATSAFQDVLDELAQAHARLAREQG
jgi:hypothetical protein